MLTFSATGLSSLRVSGGPSTLTVFPDAVPSKMGEKDVVLASAPHDSKSTAVISWPGEYNQGGVSIKGIGHEDGKQVSYVATVDDVRLGFLSSPLQDWTEKQLETLGDIDVLVMPAGEVKIVQKLVDEIDPRILLVLPGKDRDALKSIEKVVGVKEKMNEYKLKGALPAEGREVVVLQ